MKTLRVAQSESQKGETSVVRLAYDQGDFIEQIGSITHERFGAPAVLDAILDVVADHGVPNVLILRDQYLVSALTTGAPEWEKHGWENKRGRRVKNAAALRTLWLQLKAVGTTVVKADDDDELMLELVAVAARDLRTREVGPYDPVHIASDGSYRGGQAHWAWVSENGTSGRGVTEGHGSNAAELAAATHALRSVSADTPVVLTTDSRNVIDVMTRRMHNLAQKGWPTEVPDIRLIKDLYEARKGLALALRWEPGHVYETSLLAKADALVSNR